MNTSLKTTIAKLDTAIGSHFGRIAIEDIRSHDLRAMAQLADAYKLDELCETLLDLQLWREDVDQEKRNEWIRTHNINTGKPLNPQPTTKNTP